MGKEAILDCVTSLKIKNAESYDIIITPKSYQRWYQSLDCAAYNAFLNQFMKQN
jgi:hypothetical protein